MSGSSKLSKRLAEVEAERDYYRNLLEIFFGEDIPPQAFMPFILAKWGRKRREEQRTVPALLKSD